MSSEPGLDRHEWESEWAQLEPLLRDSPREALPEARDLVERMLRERGYVGNGRVDPEISADWQAAKGLVDRIEAGEPVDPGDVGSAVGGLKAIFDYLIAERPAP
jgi:hypothetical protein